MCARCPRALSTVRTRSDYPQAERTIRAPHTVNVGRIVDAIAESLQNSTRAAE
jgi:hypothetical protein